MSIFLGGTFAKLIAFMCESSSCDKTFDFERFEQLFAMKQTYCKYNRFCFERKMKMAAVYCAGRDSTIERIVHCINTDLKDAFYKKINGKRLFTLKELAQIPVHSFIYFFTLSLSFL